MSIEQEINQFVQGELLGDGTEVDHEDRLLADGLVDSLGMMRLVNHIAETFEIEVPPEDIVIENFSTIARMGVYLRGRGVDVRDA